MSDELEERLRRLDPSPLDVPVDPPDNPSAAALMRSIMDTDTDTDTGPRAIDDASPAGRSWVRPLLVAAAAVAVLGGGWLALDAARDDDEPTVATYELGPLDITQMCLPVADAIPDPTAEAFAGTVTAVGDGVVTLDVDRWYTAGDADMVELRAGTDVSVALDGVEFTDGGRYLVSTVDGVVSICGVSGPATPELEQLYEQWYGG